MCLLCAGVHSTCRQCNSSCAAVLAVTGWLVWYACARDFLYSRSEIIYVGFASFSFTFFLFADSVRVMVPAASGNIDRAQRPDESINAAAVANSVLACYRDSLFGCFQLNACAARLGLTACLTCCWCWMVS